MKAEKEMNGHDRRSRLLQTLERVEKEVEEIRQSSEVMVHKVVSDSQGGYRVVLVKLHADKLVDEV